MTIYMKAETENAILAVMIDEGAINPRENFNLGTMVYGHRRYVLGDEQATNVDSYSSWNEWADGEIGNLEDYVILPLYLYDHGGITMNTTGFGCRWDSGQVGWIYCSKERFIKETGYSSKELFEEGKAKQMLENEVKEFDQFIRGDVYGYVLEKKESVPACDCCGRGEEVKKEVVDSCWGFYGNDFKENGLVDELPKEYRYLVDLLR